MTALVVDTSALVALVRGERAADSVATALRETRVHLIGAPNVVELGLVLEGRKGDAVGEHARVVRELGLQVVPFTAEHADRAVDAWRRLGKGRHPAGLNFGDCCTFALAEERGLPILCVGDDFRRTGWPVVEF